MMVGGLTKIAEAAPPLRGVSARLNSCVMRRRSEVLHD